MVFKGGKPVQDEQDHHAPREPQMHHACGVGLNPCVRERGRNLKQAKDVNRLAVCSGNEIAAKQNGEQQDIERNVRGNRADTR